MIKNYIKSALRNFYKRKLYTAINIVGLSLAIMISLMVFSYLENEISFDQFHVNKDRIYRTNLFLSYAGEEETIASSSPVMGPTFKSNISGVEDFNRVYRSYTLIRDKDQIEESRFLYTDPNFFSVFDFKLLAGNPEECLADPNSIVISRDLAEGYFEEGNALGQLLDLRIGGEFQLFKVSGIMENMPRNSSIQTDILMPLEKRREIVPERRFEIWMDLHLTTFLLLHPEADPASITDEMNKVQVNIGNIPDSEAKLSLEPLTEIHMGELTGSGISTPGQPAFVRILVILVLFIIIIACINFTNLSIGIALPRTKEIGVRKVVGARRVQVMKQFLFEAFIISLLSFLFALLLTDLLLPFFNQITGRELVFLEKDIVFIGLFGMLLILLLTFSAGFYPAKRISSFPTINSLNKKVMLNSKKPSLIWGLIVLQFSLSTILFMGSLVINDQVNFMINTDPGFNNQDIITIRTNRSLGRDMLNKFRALEGKSSIISVTAHSGNNDGTNIFHEDKELDIYHKVVEPDFISTAEIELVAGRNFDVSNAADFTNSIIVNEAFVNKLGLVDPIGTPINYDYWDNMDHPKIIGVMKDFHFLSMKETIEAIVFHINPEAPYYELWVRTVANETPEAISALEAVWKENVDFLPFNYSSLEENYLADYEEESELKKIIEYASVFAIIISAMGLFGMATLHIQQKTKEVGIRKVLGASVFHIILTLSRNYMFMTFLSIVLGILVTWYISYVWLLEFPYRTDFPIDAVLVTFLIIMVVSLATISFQLINTANTNPVNSLKDE